MRKNKGITLIALVITIIVLLILAGVSISAITGENGLVEKAKNAKDATRVAQIEEKIKLYQSENSLLAAGNETTKTMEEFVNELEKDGIITSEEKTVILEKHTLTIGNQEPIVFPFAKTLVQAFKDGEIQIGDYVKYIPSDLDATVEIDSSDVGDIWDVMPQTYTVSESTTWRVLGLNKDETELLITTGSPIRTNEGNLYLDMQGFTAYYNCTKTLNKICMIYNNEELASETRSISIEDINNALGIVVENGVVYKENDLSKTNLNIYENWGKTYTYKVGDYAPENYLKEKYPDNEEYQKLESKKAGDVMSSTAYSYSYLNENVIDSDTALYDVLFAGTTLEENDSKSYWLASNSIYIHPREDIYYFDIMNVNEGYIRTVSISSSENGFDDRMAVRPVVSLKSNITIEQVSVISGSEEIWNTTVIDNSGVLRSWPIHYGQIKE